MTEYPQSDRPTGPADGTAPGGGAPDDRAAGGAAAAAPRPAGGSAAPGAAGHDTIQDVGDSTIQDAGDDAGHDVVPGVGDAAVEAAVVDLATEDLAPADRRRAFWRVLRGQMRSAGARGLLGPKAATQWVVDTVIEVAPRLPIRDLETLRAHHRGLDGDALAERLIRTAAVTTAGIGATGGGIASVEWAVTPTLLSAPVLLAAETVAVVAVELKLIAELHEVYRRPVPGTGAQRGVALLQAWASRRGIDPLAPGRGIAAALGTAARKELRDRLLRRLGRNLSTLGPLLTGAAVAGYLNRRATTALGHEIRRDLTGPKVITGRVM